MQYVLDTLFSCYFARTYQDSAEFLEASLPYTRQPGAPESPAHGVRSASDAPAVEDTALNLVQSLR